MAQPIIKADNFTREHSIGSQSDDLLRQAANSIPIGFIMFDPQRRVVVANATFLSLYGISAERAKPGTTLEELLKERFRDHNISTEELATKVAFVEDLVGREEPHTRIDTLPNGRRISVGHRPLPDGGWVGTHEDVTEREAAAEKLRYLAHHDVLTGVKSRAYFWDALHQRVDAARTNQVAFALHFIDLDKFKAVNDRFGHEAGDFILREVAKRLQNAVRRVDIVARLGGDEFAIVQCQEGLQRCDAEALARRIIAAISEEFDFADEILEIGASLGIAFAADFTTRAADLVNAADQAMYAAKRSRGNGYVVAKAAADSG